MASVAIRPATLTDVPGIRALLAAHGNDGPISTVDVVGPYVRHVVAHGRAFVSIEEERVVGYGAAVDAGVAWHLADLFVLPDRLGHGIGRPLLEATMAHAGRRTTFASSDPRAVPLYVRAGMAPWWISLYMQGDPAGLPAPAERLEIEPADAARLAALERDWTGVDRSADHAFWASQAEADSFVVARRGEPVAVVHARARQVGPERAIDRMVVRPDADPVGPVIAALRRAARGGRVMAAIQGPSPLVPVLLAAGFRIEDHDQYMASEPGLVDPARLIPNGGML